IDAQAAVWFSIGAENRFRALVGLFNVGAHVLIRADNLNGRMRLHGCEEPFLALRCAVVPFGVSQQHDPPLCAHYLDEALAAQLAAFEVVGRHEADVVLALQPGVEDDDRDLLPHRVINWSDEGGFIERREDDARDASTDEAFNLRYLRIAIVLAKRTAPDHLDAELLRRLVRAGMNALPERVARALRNHRYRDRRRS